MADYDFWALGEASISVSGGKALDGTTSGDGSHLLGLSITINTSNFENLSIREAGNRDPYFDDDDNEQRLASRQTFDGISYNNGARVQAEYQLILRDPVTGIQYRAIAINMNAGKPNDFTVEGLAFVDVVPPSGRPLVVVGTADGPGGNGLPPLEFGSIAIPCFTPGTMIDTPQGPRPVEDLVAGDMVLTQDNGPQVLRWVGHAPISEWRMAVHPELRPVRVKKGAFGRNMPSRDMLLSPQHRILLRGARAELMYAEPEVLAAALHLVNGSTITRAWDVMGVSYIHLQCDRHEILMSDGLPSESFNPGPAVVAGMPSDTRAELQALFPGHDLTRSAPLSAARPLLTRRETAIWAA